MKLGMKAQYGVLFVLFLHQQGPDTTTRTYEAARTLDLSTAFLEQVARQLRLAGIIRSVRGPGGGYQLIGMPTIGQVLEAVGVEPILDKDQDSKFKTAGKPGRGFLSMLGLFGTALMPVMNAPISTLNTQAEVA
jgi:Rrf2 family protein